MTNVPTLIFIGSYAALLQCFRFLSHCQDASSSLLSPLINIAISFTKPIFQFGLLVCYGWGMTPLSWYKREGQSQQVLCPDLSCSPWWSSPATVFPVPWASVNSLLMNISIVSSVVSPRRATEEIGRSLHMTELSFRAGRIPGCHIGCDLEII